MGLSSDRQRPFRCAMMVFLLLSMMPALELQASPSDTLASVQPGIQTGVSTNAQAGAQTADGAKAQAGDPAAALAALPPAAPTPSPEPPVLVPPPPVPAPGSVASRHSDSLRSKITEALLQESFTYEPREMADPFVSFIVPLETSPVGLPKEDDEPDLPPVPQKPLTPLQKMSLAEIENGLKAITWGELGRRAVIEDAAGKGYIVGVGTPAGGRNGVITQIFNDSLVIQQETWDKKSKRMIAQNALVKLKKEKEK
ncbi:hypothetical protein DAMNIGENAA_19990 [Desulforhabdus amnigena]|uniref:Pilus assembly protein PilP n=2 Tax=Desulforhabdus amnigena TaxID=40218 RepID=A0A9W6FTX1_9BACT|nr:hypothetical protein DAMNIGENAA_19990 [Desulforhabdus amnigena]